MITSARRDVLLAWELGGGLGHARRLLQVASELRLRGWSPVVAARNLWACTDEYRQAGIPLVQAPLSQFHAPTSGPFAARGYADIMAACGYQTVDTLWPTVMGWDGLIDTVRPRLIIADYSPMLALAAYDRVPLIAIGSGFAVPPCHLTRLPLLRSTGTAMLDESAMQANVTEVQRRRGYAVPEGIPSLLGGYAQVVCTFPEIDIYSEYRVEPAAGPVTGRLKPLPRPSRRAVFAYLEGGHPSVRDIMRALVRIGVPIEVFIRNASQPQQQAMRAAGIFVYDTPPPLPAVLTRSSIVVHHGGIGTMETCLALGRPQILAPLHLEHTANAKQLMKFDIAACLLPERTPSENEDLLSAMIASESIIKRSMELAALVDDRQTSVSLERITTACDALGN